MDASQEGAAQGEGVEAVLVVGLRVGPDGALFGRDGGRRGDAVTPPGGYAPAGRRGSRRIAHSVGPPPGSLSSSRTVKPKCS